MPPHRRSMRPRQSFVAVLLLAASVLLSENPCQARLDDGAQVEALPVTVADHELSKRDQTSAPFKAALRATKQQREQLWGLMLANETLAKGWEPTRDPHDALAPLLESLYGKSFGSEPSPTYDPYPSDLRRPPAAPLRAWPNTTNLTALGLKVDASLAHFPFPPSAYYSAISGFWNSPAWSLRSEFVAYSSAAHQRLAGRKDAIDRISGGLRARYAHRQRDLLTLLFGPGYPGSSAAQPIGAFPRSIEGGSTYIFLTEDRLIADRVSTVGGTLQLVPASRARRAADSNMLVRRQEAAGNSNLTDDEDAINQYHSHFTYERAKQKAAEAISFDLDGFHFLKQGLVYAHALPVESSEYTDPREALKMIPLPKAQTPPQTLWDPLPGAADGAIDMESAAWFMLNDTFNALNETLSNRIRNNNASVRADRMVDQEDKVAHHNCSFHFYGHLRPAGAASLQPKLDELEQEMRSPTGISTIRPPPAELHGLLFSPDCYLAFELAPAKGDLDIARASKMIRYAICFFVVLLVQALLTTRQMDRSATPSAISKISAWSWSMQCLLEVCAFGFHIVFPILDENRASRAMYACAFLAAILFIALQYQHTLSMFHIQAPAARFTAAAPAPAPEPTPSNVPPGDEADQEREPQRAAPAADSTSANASEAEAPGQRIASTVQLQAAPSAIWSRIRAVWTAHPALSKFALVAAGVWLGMQLTITSTFLILYSFWVPQIWRNMARGTRKAVEVRYIIGISLCRMFLPAYYLGCPANWIRSTDLNYSLLLVTGAWLTLQAAILIGQAYFGTHFWVPRALRPQDLSWEWHPPLETLSQRRDPETGAMTVGNCSVCLSAIEVDEPGDKHQIDAAEDEEAYARKDVSGDEDEPLLASGSEGLRRRYGSAASSETRRRTWYAPLTSIARPLLTRIPDNMRLSARHGIMVTPCHHKFHTACLEQWLQVKTECPQCRAPLPPV